ncbi:uncharacterized protein LOC135811434 [Sycon ciliatum]|uniref:uncharacterized protein LOC135811434 n=1 Tax=Sycon ciliatum TaxID=27933 RepID=UPI0031F621E0
MKSGVLIVVFIVGVFGVIPPHTGATPTASSVCTSCLSPKIMTIANHNKLTSATGAGPFLQPRTIIPFPNISFYSSCSFVQIDITAEEIGQSCNATLVLLKEFPGKKYQTASKLIPPSKRMAYIATWTGVRLQNYISYNSSAIAAYIIGMTLQTNCQLNAKATPQEVTWILPQGSAPDVLQTYTLGAALEPRVTMTIRASNACEQSASDNCQTLYQSCPGLGATGKIAFQYYCSTASHYACPATTMVQSTTTQTAPSALPSTSTATTVPAIKPATTLETNSTAKSDDTEGNSTESASMTVSSPTTLPPSKQSTSAVESTAASMLHVAISQPAVYIGVASGILLIITCVVVLVCYLHCRKNKKMFNMVKRKLPSIVSVAGLGMRHRSGTDINHYETVPCRNSEGGERFESLSEPNEQPPPELPELHRTDDTVDVGQTARSQRSRRLKALHNMPRVSEDTATPDSSPEHEISAECPGETRERLLKAKPSAAAERRAVLRSPGSASIESNTDYGRQQDFWRIAKTGSELYCTPETLNSGDMESAQVQRRASTVSTATCPSVCPSDYLLPSELLSAVDETPEKRIPVTRRTSIEVREKLSETNDYLCPAEVVVRVRTPSTTVPPQTKQSRQSSLSTPCYELVTEFPADTRKTRKPSATPSLTTYDTPGEILQQTKTPDVTRASYEDILPEPGNSKPRLSRFVANKLHSSTKSQQRSFKRSNPPSPHAYEMVEITPTMSRATQPHTGTLEEPTVAQQAQLHVQQSFEDDAPQFIDLGSGIPANVITSSTTANDVIVNPVAFLQNGKSLEGDNEYMNVSLDDDSLLAAMTRGPDSGKRLSNRRSSLPGVHEPKLADKSVSKL